MAIVGPTDLVPPLANPDLNVSGPLAMVTGMPHPAEEFAAKVGRFIRLMGPVLDFLMENPEIAPAARSLFSSLASTARKSKEEGGGKPVTTGPSLPGLPAPPMLVPPGPGPILPGPAGMLRP